MKSFISYIAQIPPLKERTSFYLSFLFIFWLIVAVLEFGQDYLDSRLHNGTFVIYESLAYKLYWLLFIPCLIAFVSLMNKLRLQFSGVAYHSGIVVLSLFISLIQLLVFSLTLYGISNLIHEHGWSMTMLLTEKLSTRLYISLAVYLTAGGVYIWLKKSEIVAEKTYLKTIPIRVGKKSIVVNVDEVKWIKAEGTHLALHTDGKKYVVFNSLKKLNSELNPDQFKRIHKSTIINLNNVAELKSRLNGDYDVLLNCGEKLRLSRNYVKSVKGILL